ncbi:hypothetical protein GQ600_16164 [Phytophthora cactorum]|nr:hypothetical protein GQ600_16164 [Phytophthora cactorum]
MNRSRWFVVVAAVLLSGDSCMEIAPTRAVATARARPRETATSARATKASQAATALGRRHLSDWTGVERRRGCYGPRSPTGAVLESWNL